MKKAFVFVVLLLFAGCSSLGIVKPKSFSESYAYALTTNASVRSAATSALQQGAITEEDAGKVLLATDAVRLALDQAIEAVERDPSSAEEYLQVALESLDNVMQFLLDRGIIVGEGL